MVDINQYPTDDLDIEAYTFIYKDISSKLFDCSEFPPPPLENILKYNSVNIITRFRTKSLQNYDKEEFSDKLPKELKILIEREPALIKGLELEYHNERINYIKKLFKEVEKNPTILKFYEGFLLKFFFENLVYSDNSSKFHSNAVLQFLQLESNISDLYILLSTKKFGFKEYISGIGDNGKLYAKIVKKVDNLIPYWDSLHSHAITFLNFNPEKFQDIIPNNAVWATNPKRFNGIPNRNNGRIGFNMLISGLDNKHFHSSLPHNVIINNNNIKKIVIKDAPPDQIYFCTHFLDDTISFGTMSPPNNEGIIVAHTSDLLSDFLQGGVASTHNSLFLFDLAGCIARDMFVLEERNKFYNISEVKAKSEKIRQKKKIEEKIIWLPRFKINFNGEINSNDLEDKLIKLSPCHVSGHPRKCENPSEKQIELAEKFGVKLPPGFTYVKEYDKSGSKEFVRSYKSRSAMQLIYGS